MNAIYPERPELAMCPPAHSQQEVHLSQPQDISRTAMTAWIVGALAVIAFVGLGIGLKIANENPRYPGCTGWFGVADKQCEYEIASQRLGAL